MEAVHAADLALARAVGAGDEAAMDRMLRRLECVPRIVSAMNRQLGMPLNPEERNDLVQDALLVIWKKLGQFAGDAKIETWVYRVCRLELLNALRRKRRQIATLPAFDSVEPEDPSAAGEQRVLRAEMVLMGLDRLEPEEAAVVRLRHYEQLTFDEVAAALSISPNTAKTRYYRALGRLRTHLAPLLARVPPAPGEAGGAGA